MDLYEKKFSPPKAIFSGLSSFICAYFKLFTVGPSKSLTWEDWVDSWVLAVLNSTVCYWFYDQISPQIQNGYFRFKAQYCKQIPIPSSSIEQQEILRALVALITLAAQSDSATPSNTAAPEYERLLNGLVYELFFPEDLHAKAIHLFDACAAAGIREGMDAQAIATAIFHPRHPIYGMLFDLQAIEVVRLIEGIDA